MRAVAEHDIEQHDRRRRIGEGPRQMGRAHRRVDDRVGAAERIFVGAEIDQAVCRRRSAGKRRDAFDRHVREAPRAAPPQDDLCLGAQRAAGV